MLPWFLRTSTWQKCSQYWQKWLETIFGMPSSSSICCQHWGNFCFMLQLKRKIWAVQFHSGMCQVIFACIRGFNNGQALGKWTHCLFWPPRGMLFLYRSWVQKVFPSCKIFPTENISETPDVWVLFNNENSSNLFIVSNALWTFTCATGLWEETLKSRHVPVK